MFRRALTIGLSVTGIAGVSLALATPALADTTPQCSGSTIVCAGVDLSGIENAVDVVLGHVGVPALPSLPALSAVSGL